MRLTNIAILAIRGAGLNKELAKALDVSVSTVNRYIVNNDDNLTKAAALEVIKKELGLTEDQILEREPLSEKGEKADGCRFKSQGHRQANEINS